MGQLQGLRLAAAWIEASAAGSPEERGWTRIPHPKPRFLTENALDVGECDSDPRES